MEQSNARRRLYCNTACAEECTNRRGVAMPAAHPARPILLYRYALSGHCHRVELFLRLLGLPSQPIDVDLRQGEQKRAEFLALNAFGQVPVIDDAGTVVSDSNAILTYLALRYAERVVAAARCRRRRARAALAVGRGRAARLRRGAGARHRCCSGWRRTRKRRSPRAHSLFERDRADARCRKLAFHRRLRTRPSPTLRCTPTPRTRPKATWRSMPIRCCARGWNASKRCPASSPMPASRIGLAA